MMDTTKQGTAQTSSLPDDWQDTFLMNVLTKSSSKEWLFSLLETVSNFLDTPDPTSAINEMFGVWVVEKASVLPEKKYALRDVMKLVAFIAELRVDFDCFDSDTDYTNIVIDVEEKREVNNG